MSRRQLLDETSRCADSTQGSAPPSTVIQPEGPVLPVRESQVTASWTVYMLRCADGSLYTGITNAPQKRLQQHLRGKASRYTRARLPVVFVYQELAGTRGDALRREASLKRLKRQEKLKLIESSEQTVTKPRSRRVRRRLRTEPPDPSPAQTKEQRQ